MKNSIINWYEMTDTALLQWIAGYIRSSRLRQNRTQQEVAAAAGVNRSTIVQLEKGTGGTLMSLIQVLRALGQLELLQAFAVDDRPTPLQLAKLELGIRQRASRPKAA